MDKPEVIGVTKGRQGAHLPNWSATKDNDASAMR